MGRQSATWIVEASYRNQLVVSCKLRLHIAVTLQLPGSWSRYPGSWSRYPGLSLLGHPLCLQEERLRSDRQRSPHIRNLRNEAYGNRRVYKTSSSLDVCNPSCSQDSLTCLLRVFVCLCTKHPTVWCSNRHVLFCFAITTVLYFLNI